MVLVMFDYGSGLESKDTLNNYTEAHNGRLPVDTIPEQAKELKEPNKALKIFDKEK